MVSSAQAVELAQIEDPPEEQRTPAAEAPPAPAPDDEGSEAAQQAPAGVEVLEVRGRGSAAIEAEVPSSLTQFDAATIEALGAQDISDLSRVTPNVNIVQPGATQATFFVRGIGLSDFSSNAAGAVAIFQDDVAINAPAIQTGQLYDVEGIDIVKGPQGTGAFRNASGGAITVRSKRPSGNFGATLRSTLGRYDTKGDKGAVDDAYIRDFEGALEAPLVEELLSARFAFRLRDSDPYRKNGCGDAPPFDQRQLRPTTAQQLAGVALADRDVCGERTQAAWPNNSVSLIPVGLPDEVNDEHNWAARGTFRFQPRDSESEFFFNAHGSRLDQDSTLGQAIGTRPIPGNSTPTTRFGGSTGNPGYVDADVIEELTELCGAPNPIGIFPCVDTFPGAGNVLAKNLAEGRPLDIRPYRGDYNRVGQVTRDTYGAFVSGEFEVFEDMKLFALSSYDRYERFQDIDTDFTPEQLFELIQEDDAWQMYHDVQLSGELEAEPIEWSLGTFYLQEHLDNDGTFLLPPAATTPITSRRIFSQKIDSFAAWGEFSWDFLDDFTLGGGVRWNWEQKRYRFLGIDRGVRPLDANSSDVETWHTPTGQLILTYHIDQTKSAYARYTRGFKAGHFNGTGVGGTIPVSVAVLSFEADPADEEYNDAWEAGLRGSWLDGLINLSGAFFYYRYENYQVFLFTDSGDPTDPPVLEILNAKQAENFGIEIEGSTTPLRGWAPRILEGLRLSGNFSWLHGEFLNFTTTRRFTGAFSVAPVDVPIDYSGKQLQNAPEYKVSGSVEWSFDLGRFGYLIPRYDVNWSDDQFFDTNEGRGSIDPTGGPALIDYGVGQKAYYLHNVRLAYRTPSGNVELAGWVRNVEDEVYKNFAFDASRFTQVVINFPGEPRTIGMDLIFTF